MTKPWKNILEIYFWLWFDEAINGVIPNDKPIQNNKINPNIELDNETAASWLTPSLPTMILSTTPTVICPNWLSIIGNERNKFFFICKLIFIRVQI